MELGEILRERYRPKKIGIVIPWSSPFIWSHPMFNLFNLDRPAGVDVRVFMGRGRDPGRRHMCGVDLALKWGATHICFLGADQIHDQDILLKFTEHMENGWSMATALVPVRGWVRAKGVTKPFQKIAWKLKKSDGGNINFAKFDQDYLEVLDPADGDLQECAVVGSGAMMFDVNIIKNLEKPWFPEAEPDIDGWRPAKMDTGWCWRMVTEGGGRMVADCTINVLHLDILVIDDTTGDRFSDWGKDEAEENLYRYL